MNPKARKFKVRPCVVCGYKYSDMHHLYPRHDGGNETVALCPNHHRYANMIQVIIRRNGWLGEKRAREFAQKYFEPDFNEKMLDRLIGEYFLTSPYDENGLTEADYAETPTTPITGSLEQRSLALSKTLGKLEAKHGNHDHKK